MVREKQTDGRGVLEVESKGLGLLVKKGIKNDSTSG